MGIQMIESWVVKLAPVGSPVCQIVNQGIVVKLSACPGVTSNAATFAVAFTVVNPNMGLILETPGGDGAVALICTFPEYNTLFDGAAGHSVSVTLISVRDAIPPAGPCGP